MSEPGKPIFRPLDVAQAAANLAATAYPGAYEKTAPVQDALQGKTQPSSVSPPASAPGSISATGLPFSSPVSGGLTTPVSRSKAPEVQLRAVNLLRGISRVATQERLPRLSMPWATLLSAGLHVLAPVGLVLAVLGVLWVFAFLMHLNFWDFFRSKPPQDMTFTLTEKTQVLKPEHPLFKGPHNQQAGGKQNHHQPINPDKDPVSAHPQPAASKPPTSKPLPQPSPVKPAMQSKPAPKPVTPQAKPQKQPKAQLVKEKTVQPVAVRPTIAQPMKIQKPDPSPLKLPVPKVDPVQPASKSVNQIQAPEPIQVSSRTTDFGISTTRPSGAVAPNPQDGKVEEIGVDVAEDIYFGPFMADIKKRINRNWIPPRGMESRKVVLVFFVRHDGQLVDLQVQKSSGDDEADRRAIEAIQASAPFMALPPQIKEDILPVEFTFDYNVLNPKNAKHAMKW